MRSPVKGPMDLPVVDLHPPQPAASVRPKDALLPPGRPPSRLQTWLDAPGVRQPRVDRLMLAALGAAMVVFAASLLVGVLRGHSAYDYDLWYFTAQNYLHHRPIYPRGMEFSFIYPPSAAAMLALPATLGKPAFVLALAVLNSLAWLTSVLLTVWLVTGRVARQHPLLALLPTLAMGYWIRDTYKLGQPALVLLALMLGVAACLRRGRPALAGALLGTAAAIKAYPVLAVGYLVYRRHWKATAATLVTLAGWLLVAPLAFRSPEKVVDDLAAWTRGVALTYDEHSISQRGMHGYSFRNQSIVGVANRLLRPVPANGEADPRWTVNLATLGFDTVNAAILAGLLGLGLFFIWCVPPWPMRTSRTETIEWGMVLLLIVMTSPLSFDYSYVWMLYPLGVATGLALAMGPGSNSRRRLGAWIVASLLVQALAVPMHHEAQAYGNVFFSALILLIGLGLELRSTHAPRHGSPGPNAALD